MRAQKLSPPGTTGHPFSPTQRELPAPLVFAHPGDLVNCVAFSSIGRALAIRSYFIVFPGINDATGPALFCFADRFTHKTENFSICWSIVLHAHPLLYISQETLLNAWQCQTRLKTSM